MKRSCVLFLATLFLFASCSGQTAAAEPGPDAVPHLVRYIGTSSDAATQGKTVSVVFSVYDQQQGGTALWSETQTVTVDDGGHFAVMLGSATTDGLPATLFTTGDTRWLGVTIASQPETRERLISVPYAMKAGDAQTLGGLPASAYALAGASPTSVSRKTLGPEITAQINNGGPTSGTINMVPKFDSSTTIKDSQIFDNGTAVGIGTTSPEAGYKLDVHGKIKGDNLIVSDQQNFFTRSDTRDCGIGLVGPYTVTGNFTLMISSGFDGFRGYTDHPCGNGMEGIVTSYVGNTYGVYGQTNSDIGSGVVGEANYDPAHNTGTGTAYGTQGLIDGPKGVGVLGMQNDGGAYPPAVPGDMIGIEGLVSHTNSIAGVFDNTAPGGKVLSGRQNGVESFAVLSNGEVRANAFRDLNGNALPLSGDGSGVTNLNAANVASGTIPTARLQSGANGVALLDGAGKLTSAMMPDAYLPLTGGTLTGNLFGTNATMNGAVSASSLNLPLTLDSTHGVITLGGVSFIHSYGPSNTFVGSGSGSFGATGSGNTGVGQSALSSNASGFGNTAVGSGVMSSNVFGAFNTAVGATSLAHGDSAFNTAIGYAAMNSNTSGSQNSAVGYQSLFKNTTGQRNVATGDSALLNNTSGGFNTAIGSSAMSANVTGHDNSALGALALSSNTTGFWNTAVGEAALQNNVAGSMNTAVGYSAQGGSTGGSQNTSIGFNSMGAITSGYENTAEGSISLPKNTTGTSNTASGYFVMTANTTGSYNTAMGSNALYPNVSGSSNVAIGESSGGNSVPGSDNKMGSFNTFLGTNTGVGIATPITNATAIGANATVSQSNSMVLGDGSVNVGIGTSAPSQKLDVAGVIRSSTGGFRFPDGTTQATASAGTISGVTAGDGLFGGGTTGAVTLAVDATVVRRNDPRLSDARAPLAGSSAYIQNGTTQQSAVMNIDGPITTGSILNLPATTDFRHGVIYMGTSSFAHSFGVNSLFVGQAAGNLASASPTGNNTGLGYQSLSGLTTGFDNTGVGTQALMSTSTGDWNTGVGQGALQSTTTGGANTAVGWSSLSANIAGNGNTALGGLTLNANTAGFNTALGYTVLKNNTTGMENSGVGVGVLLMNTTGGYNTGVGASSLGFNTTGSDNVAMGYSAMEDSYTGSQNTAIGTNALFFNNDGNNNTAIGWNALSSQANGSNNTALGSGAAQGGVFGPSGSNNTFLGASTGGGSYLTNATAIGYGALVLSSNSMVLGNGTVNVGIGTSSPTQKLDVAGVIRTSTGGIQFPDNTIQTSAATSGATPNATFDPACGSTNRGSLYFNTTTSELRYCNGSQFVVVAQTSAVPHKLTANQSAMAPGASLVITHNANSHAVVVSGWWLNPATSQWESIAGNPAISLTQPDANTVQLTNNSSSTTDFSLAVIF